MATMSQDELTRKIHDILEAEDLPDEGIGAVLIRVGNEFGLAVSAFTPEELGENISSESIEDVMVAAGNNFISSYDPR